MDDFGAAHERHLASYRRYMAEVWCPNPECIDFGAPQQVLYQSEYGQGWYEPEQCERCGSEWTDEPPDEEEEDDGEG